ncbi:uncharacterized protein LOC127103039 [Lathyrus oleraceus]|uniref:uncharacterized protein LOC127103039 n=1 Tax=Pisum sativum TaxID=3888 RepID=UPI0021D04A4F|nr:uncharacterized protein LOC127103039 [Pisum sativum]
MAEQLENENKELKEEVSRLSALVESLLQAQKQAVNVQASTSNQAPEVAPTSIPAPVMGSVNVMPFGYPWGMPNNFMPEGHYPQVHAQPTSSPVPAVPPPVVNFVPIPAPIPQVRVDETIYHSKAFENPNVYDKIDDMRDQFSDLRKDMKALRGKELFGKSASELCLVPNVKIPMKFKVPDFEKYKGNICPLNHMVMYARKMSTHTDKDQLLIHYFQDILSGAALKWYKGLDCGSVCTFNDLSEAFVRQYKYNVDMALDRDQLRATSKKYKETFKEYA